ncbi:MAG: tyrosine-protein phosphatase, partial [Isosphaeraceae bacterium]
WVPNGATWTSVNIYGTYAPPPTSIITTSQQATNYMLGSYQAFVLDPLQREGFRTLLLDLAHCSGPAMFHCSAGKDRTGWASMLLESIAGVSQPTIMKDYMASDCYMKEEIKQQQAQLQENNMSYLDPITVVCPSYLQTGLAQVAASYGSMNAYLTQGLGLTQADIYVLRAKMVYYATLPGQSGFAGNAAAGAALLNALQNSPLSGAYTSYNYYLQSSIDAGTLGGVPSQIGGQVYADAASNLLREPLWLDWAMAPNTDGRDLGVGQRRFWLAGLGDYFESEGRAGAASSTEGSGGSLVGVTYRASEQFCADLGIGVTAGSVGSAGASAAVDTVPLTLGGRLGFFTLEAGPYVAASADLDWADCRATRVLGGSLGTAEGCADGGVYSAQVDLGDAIRLASLTITPQVGVRITSVSLGSFNESGSELALGVSPITHTVPSFLADLAVAPDPQPWLGWIIVPSVDLGCELALSDPQVESTGGLYGFTVSQYSAYDSWLLMKIGFAVTAQRGPCTVGGGVNAVFGDEASAGIIAQLSLGYSF